MGGSLDPERNEHTLGDPLREARGVLAGIAIMAVIAGCACVMWALFS